RLRDPLDSSNDCASSISNACGSEYGNPRGYQGSFLSNVTGLYDMRARAYDPNLRIFLSPDPLGYVDGFDVWQYTAGDPLNLVDPFGFDGGQRDKNPSNAPDPDPMSPSPVERVDESRRRGAEFDALVQIEKLNRRARRNPITIVAGDAPCPEGGICFDECQIRDCSSATPETIGDDSEGSSRAAFLEYVDDIEGERGRIVRIVTDV